MLGAAVRKLLPMKRTGQRERKSVDANKPWLKHLGKLKHLHKETQRINRLIEKDSERIDPEMWR
jgi:hypothetical protein